VRTACDCLWGLLLYVLCTGMFAFTGLTAAQVESMREVKACPPPPLLSLLLLLGFCWFANPQNNVERLVLTILCQIGPPNVYAYAPVVGRWRGST
jgi:hypothetical protein